MTGATLLAVPNVSEGRDETTIAAVAEAFQATGARLLDVHRDPDHNRSVFTLAGPPRRLSAALVSGARAALERIDMRRHQGIHPCVGALDVAPIVHLDDQTRGAACVEALVAGDELGRELDLPVLVYGPLARGRTRSELRSGGTEALARRFAAQELVPDFGPPRVHPTGGVTLLAARSPLVAFNLQLAPRHTLEDAQRIAALVREGGAEGLPHTRAIGLRLASRDTAQVSFNVDDPARTPLSRLVEAVRRHAEPAAAELVGLAPRVAFQGFPADLPIPGFDPARHLIENVLNG